MALAPRDVAAAQAAAHLFSSALAGVFPEGVAWDMRVITSATPVDGDPFPEGTFMVIVEHDACPEDGAYQRFGEAVAQAWKASGLSEYTMFDGTEYDSEHGRCPRYSYHFYAVGEPGTGIGSAGADEEQALIEQQTSGRDRNPVRRTMLSWV